MLTLAAVESTKGTEYLIAIVFLVVFLIFLRLFKTPGKSEG